MIYTSYFGAIRYFPKDVIPITICGKAPDNWKGIQYKKLAPKYKFFMEWKKNHNNEYYIKHFNDEVLSGLDVDIVVEELYTLAGGRDKDIVLICYEAKGFCHRHLVAEWLTEHGYSCTELSIIKEK